MSFSNILIGWYLKHKRDLPWRDTKDPYWIWLSEIMLQQTRVAQGLPYFLTFVEHFPQVSDLAAANEEKVLRLWQGLGYYSRARNLHKTAQYVAFELDGKFPDNYNELLRLKGIGEYTAAAIASFSYDEAVPVVDGNVFRVLSRYFDIETDIANASAKKEFAALAFQLMPKENPAMFNQSIMEFGALQCTPKSPDCGVCPLNESCLALKYNKVNQLPVKSKKAKPTQRFLNYQIYVDEADQTRIVKQTGKGIWHNLYEFPKQEYPEETENLELVDSIVVRDNIISIKTLESKSVIHKLTHQTLNITFTEIKVKGKIDEGVAISDLGHYPFPIVLHNFIEKHWK
jgi:A/G-specific adenine glycosylase